MKLPLALAVVIGVLAVIITYLYVGPLASLGLFVPATFIGAASYFAAGGTTSSLVPSLSANIFGIIGGVITLYLVGLAAPNPLLIGLYVGIMTAIVIFAMVIPFLSFVVGTVLGFATTAGYGLLSVVDDVGPTTLTAAAFDFSLPSGVPTVILLSFIIGGLYGWVSSLIVGRWVGTPAESDSAAA